MGTEYTPTYRAFVSIKVDGINHHVDVLTHDEEDGRITLNVAYLRLALETVRDEFTHYEKCYLYVWLDYGTYGFREAKNGSQIRYRAVKRRSRRFPIDLGESNSVIINRLTSEVIQ